MDPVDAGRLPPRIVRIPFTPRTAEPGEDADAGWAPGPPLPIPFLTMPGETETAARDETPADTRQPIALPTMRVFDGARQEPAGARDESSTAQAEWAGFAEPRESPEAFLARAARVAGQRLRPAAEIVGAAPAAVEPVAVREAIALPSVTPGAERDAYPTVLAREVVAAPVRPAEGAEWPAPDVTDLLDALASEIAREYRRYYGE